MDENTLRVLIGWKEIAAYLNCSRSTAVRRVEDGLPAFRLVAACLEDGAAAYMKNDVVNEDSACGFLKNGWSCLFARNGNGRARP